jgi:hypothetical protein
MSDGSGGERQKELRRQKRRWGGEGELQPIDNFVVREREDEFVDHAIDAYGSGNELEVGVGGVIEDEMVAIEGG